MQEQIKKTCPVVKMTKSKSFSTTGIIPYFLILIILAGVGVFGLGVKANAQMSPVGGNCWKNGSIIVADPAFGSITGKADCENPPVSGYWQATGTPPPAPGSPGGSPPPPKTVAGNNQAFENELKNFVCGFNWGFSIFPGCLIQLLYYVLYVFPAFLLGLVAYFFNILIYITLDSALLIKSIFISNAWAIVRDLSNIFFILILLYIAIKIILGLGGSEAKKMIAKVIIIALLINFSMFFTHVVIDTSNILALVFYNKLGTGKKEPVTGNVVTAFYESIIGEKDISGGLVSAFDATNLMNEDFFKAAKVTVVPGKPATPGNPGDPVPTGMMIGIIVISGLILLFATYALFISGLSFVGRLIELFVLIIFSPFAFMSSTIPLLEKVEYIGWDAWLKRLLTVSFMAPIFMFFLYFIFMLTNANIFGDSLAKGGEGIIMALLRIAIPGMVILMLLMKATEFAKKGSGALGEAIIKGGTMLAGIAGGVALGGAGLALRTGIGGGGGLVANKAASIANRLGATKIGNWNVGNTLGFNKLASGLTSVGKFAQKSSFDIRGTGIGKAAFSATGLNVGEAQKGGIEQTRKNKVEKDKKRADELGIRGDEGLKQALNKTEGDLQGLLGDNAQEIETVDKLIEKKRQEVADAQQRFNAGQISQQQLGLHTDELNNAKNRKTALVNGTDFQDPNSLITYNYSQSATTASGESIDDLEKLKKGQAQAIKTESARRSRAYADRTQGKWYINPWRKLPGFAAANREAASEIRKGTKLDSGTKTT